MNKVEKVEVEKFEDEYGGFAFVKNMFRADKNEEYLKGFKEWHLLLLVYIQRFTVFHTNKMNFTLGWIYDYLNITDGETVKIVRAAFNDLIEMGLVELEKEVDLTRKNNRVTVNKIDYGDTFTKIYHSELDKIIDIKNIDNEQKGTLLFIFTVIVSRINSETGYSYPSYDSISYSLGIENGDKRIAKALTLLVDNGLLVYDNLDIIVLKTGELTKSHNIYVRCIDPNHVRYLNNGLEYRRSQLAEHGLKEVKSKDIKSRVSVRQKLNNLWKKFDDGTLLDDELDRLNRLELEYYELNKTNSNSLRDLEERAITIALDEKLELINSKLDIKIESKIGNDEPVRLTEEEIENLFK